jgi:hypothetical protein
MQVSHILAAVGRYSGPRCVRLRAFPEHPYITWFPLTRNPSPGLLPLQVLAFGLGALTSMPAVRNFSICAAIAVGLDFLLQVREWGNVMGFMV